MQKSEVNLEQSRTWTLCNDSKVGVKYRDKFEKEFGGSFHLHRAKKWIWNSPVEEVAEPPKKEVKKTTRKRRKKTSLGIEKEIYSNEVSKTSYERNLDEKE